MVIDALYARLILPRFLRGQVLVHQLIANEDIRRQVDQDSSFNVQKHPLKYGYLIGSCHTETINWCDWDRR